MWVLLMCGLAASWIIMFLVCLSMIFNAAFIDASLQSLLFITIFILVSIQMAWFFIILAHLLLVTIMSWSNSLRALTEYDSMVLLFILYSCLGVFWLNLVLLPAASIMPVFMLVFTRSTQTYFRGKQYEIVYYK